MIESPRKPRLLPRLAVGLGITAAVAAGLDAAHTQSKPGSEFSYTQLSKDKQAPYTTSADESAIESVDPGLAAHPDDLAAVENFVEKHADLTGHKTVPILPNMQQHVNTQPPLER